MTILHGLTLEALMPVIKALLILMVGLFISSLVARSVARLLKNRVSKQHMLLTRRIIYSVLIILFLMSALDQMGFDLNILLGTAGIFTLAIGIASQTSVSNLISGLFLIIERPFVIGDTISVNNISGELVSIDLLSIKLKTPDNRFVRIPNDTVIKTAVINNSRYSTRRFDCVLGVAYKEDLIQVEELLKKIANENDYSLDSPEPSVAIIAFADSSVQLKLCVWCEREHFSKLKLSLQQQLKASLEAYKVEMPFPQLNVTLHQAEK